VDILGQVVGLNIARSDRVTSYMVPAQTASSVVQQLFDDARD
jgi:hypothetical protein